MGDAVLYDGPTGTHQWYDGSQHPWEFKRAWHLEPSLDDPDTVYAGVEDAAMFRSSDGGKSWHELPCWCATSPRCSRWRCRSLPDVVIRVVLPAHLKTLAGVSGEVELPVELPPTVGRVLTALEERFPVLRGSIRDHGTLKRRDFVRYCVCEEDWSLNPADTPLPAPGAEGREPLLVMGAVAGG